jgi:hypothetical protein
MLFDARPFFDAQQCVKLYISFQDCGVLRWQFYCGEGGSSWCCACERDRHADVTHASSVAARLAREPTAGGAGSSAEPGIVPEHWVHPER